MASFAEMIYGTATDVNKGTGESIGQIAQIAQQYEALQMKRQQLEMQKQELQNAKVGKIYDYLSQARNFKNAGDRNNYLKSALGYRNMLGISPQEIPDDAITGLGSDENMGRMFSLAQAVKRGEMNYRDAADLAFNPAKRDAFAKIVPTPPELMSSDPDLGQAQKEFLDRNMQERALEARSQDRASGQAAIQGRFNQAQKTKLADKVTNLGIPGMKAAFSELDSIINIDQWKPGQNIPGISGTDAALPTNRLRGNAAKVRGASMSIGNQILKLRSGAAVSDAEAMRTLTELGMTPTIGEGGTWTGLTFKGTTSPEVFVQGMRRARSILQDTESVFRNAYGKEVYDEVTKPSAKPPNDESVSIFGRSLTRQQWQQFLNKHPDDPAAPTIKKQLGIK